MNGSRRPDWDAYGIFLAETAALRSEDPFVKVGAVAMRRDHSIAGIGYNGAPPGVEIDWSDRDQRRARVVHAEVNALRWTNPREMADGTMFCTLHPCKACLTVIASYGIKRVVFRDAPDSDHYSFEELNDLCEEFGIESLQEFDYRFLWEDD